MTKLRIKSETDEVLTVNNPDEQNSTEQPEYDIIEDDDAPLGEKPKRKHKSTTTGIPWRWVLPAFGVGAGLTMLAVLVLVVGRVSEPVTTIFQEADTTTPFPVLPSPTPPPFLSSASVSTMVPSLGGHIEDIAWQGDQMLVARSNPSRLDIYNYQDMVHLGEIQPFNFTNDGFDKFVALAVHPAGHYTAALNTNYVFTQGDILAHADLALYDLSERWMKVQRRTHDASNLNNGNSPLPHLDAAVAYSPDGNLLASGAGGATKGGGLIALWDITDPGMGLAGPIAELYTQATGTIALAFTDDGHYLTAITRSDEGNESRNCIDCGSIHVFDVQDRSNPFPIWQIQQTPHFNLDAVKQADISDNGRYLAIPEMGNNRVVTGIEIWQLPTMQQIGIIPIDSETRISEIKDMDLSNDGQSVVFIHRQGTGQKYVNSDEPLIEHLNLYVYHWNVTESGLAYERLYNAELDPLYSAGYFLHLDSENQFIYYIDPLHQVLNRIDLNKREQVQMMQL
jgi:hypothetical protein